MSALMSWGGNQLICLLRKYYVEMLRVQQGGALEPRWQEEEIFVFCV